MKQVHSSLSVTLNVPTSVIQAGLLACEERKSADMTRGERLLLLETIALYHSIFCLSYAKSKIFEVWYEHANALLALDLCEDAKAVCDCLHTMLPGYWLVDWARSEFNLKRMFEERYFAEVLAFIKALYKHFCQCEHSCPNYVRHSLFLMEMRAYVGLERWADVRAIDEFIELAEQCEERASLSNVCYEQRYIYAFEWRLFSGHLSRVQTAELFRKTIGRLRHLSQREQFAIQFELHCVMARHFNR